MFQGTDDTLLWFSRTGKKGFRLSKGKDTIAEYFDAEGSNESALTRLQTELSYLRGGTYHIDAKDTLAEARRIFSTDFSIPPQSSTQAQVSGPSHHMPEGYISMSQMQSELDTRMKIYDLQRKNDELTSALAEVMNAKPEPQDTIGKILDHPAVQEVLPQLMMVGIGKLFGQGQIGIAGALNQNVPPVRPARQQQAPPAEEVIIETEGAQEPTGDDLTDEQDDRLIDAFYALVEREGSIENALVIMESLPLYIDANPDMYAMAKSQILKYKTTE